jgi:ATP-dependent exoDNAse (exonuclease V) beta subunit
MNEESRFPFFEQIKASAGSGKTFALTSRYLDLLRAACGSPRPACGGGPGPSAESRPEIMAVTFTNEAASQMKRHVTSALKKRAMGQDEPRAGGWTQKDAERRLGLILRHLDRLNVRTIDSLLNRILKAFALTLGIDPDFEVVFDLEETFEALFDEFTAKAEAEDDRDLELLEKALNSLFLLERSHGFMPAARLKERLLQVLRWRLKNPDAELDTDEQRLGKKLIQLTRRLQERAKILREHLGKRRLESCSNFRTLLDKCIALNPYEDHLAWTYAEKPCLADCLLKASKDGVRPDDDEIYEAFKQACGDYRAQAEILKGAAGLAAMVELAGRLAEDLHGHQRRYGVVLSDNWAFMARDAVTGDYGVSEAFCRLGAGLEALLVDEFQDTSREQWGAMSPLAVECLAGGGGLFIVGDVKQAIYGWRGGDSRLFDEVAADPELTRIAPPEKSSLPCNWRSLERIVDFNNRIFSALEPGGKAAEVATEMLPNNSPAAPDLARDLEAAFSGCVQRIPDGRDKSGGYARVSRLNAETKEEYRDGLKTELDRLLREDLLKRRRPGEVAVLVRKNEEARLVSGWLIEWGLPVVTENSLRLAEHPLVRELVSAMAFFDYPLNDLAFFEFVAGGLLLEDIGAPGPDALHEWLMEARGEGPIYRRYRRDFPDAWERLLRPFYARSAHMGPYDTLSEMVRAWRLMERYPEAEAFLRRLLEVVHAAECEGRLSLSAFLEYWRDQGPEEKLPLPAQMDAVRVMTVHKAKGLEFEAVVAPFHDWRADLSGEFGALRLDDRTLLTPLKKEVGPAFDAEKAEKCREELHLLYVAWTRPKQELHVYVRSPGSKKLTPLEKALEHLLADLPFQPAGEFEVYVHGSLPSGEAPSLPVSPPAVAAPLGAVLVDPMAWLPRLKIHRHLSESLDREELLRSGGEFDAKARGELLHAALERLAGSGADPEQALRSAACSLESSPPDPASTIAEALPVLDWALRRPELRPLIENGRPEATIMDERGELHRADLLAAADGEVVVVEYKTGGFDPAHEEQIRRYMKLAAAASGLGRARGLLVYLDRREIMRMEI